MIGPLPTKIPHWRCLDCQVSMYEFACFLCGASPPPWEEFPVFTYANGVRQCTTGIRVPKSHEPSQPVTGSWRCEAGEIVSYASYRGPLLARLYDDAVP